MPLACPAAQKPGPLDALLGPPPVLIDVRDAEAFARSRPAGAKSVPLYKPLMQPSNAYEWYRVISFGALALRPPVRNKQFLQELAAITGGKKDTPIFVICGPGGTLETTDERKVRGLPYPGGVLVTVMSGLTLRTPSTDPEPSATRPHLRQIRRRRPEPHCACYGARCCAHAFQHTHPHRPSPSVQAIHEIMVNGGYRNVSHVEGGFAAWGARDLSIE